MVEEKRHIEEDIKTRVLCTFEFYNKLGLLDNWPIKLNNGTISRYMNIVKINYLFYEILKHKKAYFHTFC